MQDATKACLGLAAAALLGSLYVLVHERRRKLKKEKRKSQSGSGANGGALTKEKLIRILGQSSAAAYQLIEQTRKMVYAKHEQTGIPLDKCVEELQQNFENAMEAVVLQVRKNHGVTEQQMTAAMVANQRDEEVQAALTTLREAMSGKPPPSPPKAATEEEQTPAARLKARRARARRQGNK